MGEVVEPQIGDPVRQGDFWVAHVTYVSPNHVLSDLELLTMKSRTDMEDILNTGKVPMTVESIFCWSSFFRCLRICQMSI